MLAVVAEASVFAALVVVGGARWSSRLAGWREGGAPDGVRLVAISTGATGEQTVAQLEALVGAARG
jgi:hypothetical protein